MLLAVQAACTYRKAVQDVPTPCNVPTTVSYKNDVHPILIANCQSKCHNDRDAGQYRNFSMEHFDQVYLYCTTTPGANYPDPWLLGNIDHLPGGYVNMPQGAAQLSECDRAIIRAWVNQGALDN